MSQYLAVNCLSFTELDISMVRPAIIVREDAGFAEVCFMLSRQSIVFIDVSIDGQSGSAIGENFATVMTMLL